jgi:CRP-like cAMP-binding protein
VGALTVTSWPLLESLPPEARQDVLAAARRRRFARGDAIFREGDLADSLYLIDSGICAVQVSAPGGERLTLNVLVAGGFFGELALLQPETGRRTAAVLALVPTETLSIAASAFRGLRTSHPAIDGLVVAALAQRVAELSQRLLEAQYEGVDRRVYRRLLELADLYPATSGAAVIPLSQDDLAALVGAARPTVNQVLQKLVSRGIITLGRRQLRVADLPALRGLAPPVGG